jgi:hypothetical protein
MLNQNRTFVSHDSHFRYLFDKIMDFFLEKRAIHSSSDFTDSDYISILEAPQMNLSNQYERCKLSRGKWKFIANNWDYTCGVYDAIEVTRQAILSAIKSNKSSAEIALVHPKDDQNYYYLVNCNAKNEHYIDVEKLKKRKAFSYQLSNHGRCECHSGISHKILFQILVPALNHLINQMNYKMHVIVLKDSIVSEQSGPFSSMYFQRDLEAIRIEWN